jgi:hypothetical protein
VYTHEGQEDEQEAAQRPDDGVRIARAGAENLAEHNDEDPEYEAGH